MASIRIISVPPGGAPEHIRAQWVGVKIPVHPTSVQTDLEKQPGWSSNVNSSGYIVSINDAIQALRDANKQEAADYWEGIKSMMGTDLRFSQKCCELVSTQKS